MVLERGPPAVAEINLLPPVALLLLNAGVAAALVPRRRDLPLPGPTLACAVAPALYGLGVIVALLLGSARLPWRPGLALAAIGTFAVPVALAATVASRRVCLALALLGAVTWTLVWLPDAWPLPWSTRTRELCAAVYGLGALTVSLDGVLRGRSGGLGRRVHVLALPLLALGTLWILLKPPEARRPVLSTSLLVAAEVALLVLVEGRLAPRVGPGRLLRALQALLLALGALLVLVVAMNLGLFPQARVPTLVAVAVATGAAVAYAALRPRIDAWMQEALYPEARERERRIAALQAELEAARARLRETEHLALVGQLAAEVAHEIKNPLGPIRGYARIIERELERLGVASEVAARGIGVIREEVEAIDARARGLLDLARPPRPTPEALDLARLVEDVVVLARGDWPAGVGLTCQAPPGPAPVEADRLLLRSALLNALQNAGAACGGRGAVTVTLEPGAEDHRVRIEDEGPGLPAELAGGGPYRPFVSRREGGHGLGLVITQGALRALGGELTLTSRAPAPGAAAVLRVPRRAAPPPPEAPPPAPAATPSAEPPTQPPAEAAPAGALARQAAPAPAGERA